MKLNEKINTIREEKDLRPIQLYRRIKQAFGSKAISRRTLVRITSGLNEPTGQSIYQISIGLGVSVKELYEGTEEKAAPIHFIPKNKPHGHYDYTQDKTNHEAFADILCSDQLNNFLAQKLVLSAKTKTRPERNLLPEGQSKRYQKWVHVIKGELTCLVAEKKFILKKGDSLHFNSHLKHHFENNSSQSTHCIIIQSPREI